VLHTVAKGPVPSYRAIFSGGGNFSELRRFAVKPPHTTYTLETTLQKSTQIWLIGSRFTVGTEKLSEKTETIPATYHPAFQSWKAMHHRCTTKEYSDAGIAVCAQWITFAAFWQDMGATWFEGAQLDRIENHGQYEPENCQWLSHEAHSQKTAQQKSNSLRTAPRMNDTGEETGLPRRAFSVKEVAKMFRVHPASVYRAIRAGKLLPLTGFGQNRISWEEINRFLRVTGAKPKKRAKRK
jgi:Helix-turn-helix domain